MNFTLNAQKAGRPKLAVLLKIKRLAIAGFDIDEETGNILRIF
jgi:hypothetical protein